MRRGLVHAGAWALSTGAAVTLSWFGVHTVLSGTDPVPPATLSVTGPALTSGPEASSTHRPAPSPSPTPSHWSSPSAKPSKSPRPGRSSHSPSPTPTKKPSGGSASARSVASAVVSGGRAAFDMGESSATLVSATPDDGWSMQVWRNTTWIRVTFTRGDGASSTIFCRWDDGPPHIQTYSG